MLHIYAKTCIFLHLHGRHLYIISGVFIFYTILTMANNVVNDAINDVVSLNGWFTTEIIDGAISYLPKLWTAIIVWILFRFIAKAIKKGIIVLSNKLGVEKIADRANINDFLNKANMPWGLSGLIWSIAYWIIFLFWINISFNTLWLDVVSNLISDLITYIPNLFIAVIVLLVWSFIAKFIKDLITWAVAASNSTNMSWAAKASYIIVMFFTIITALKQAKIDITFLTDNVNTIVMWIMLAFWLAFGLWGKEKAKEFIDKHF